MRHGAILDRALTIEWLDTALRIAAQEHQPAHWRDLLDVALRDAIPAPEARDKTLVALSHVWFAPPTAAAPMIGWALEAVPTLADTRPLHVGALLATYPFFGDVCAAVGRMTALGQPVHTPEIRRRMREGWGDRQTIDSATQRCIRTLRSIGLLAGDLGSSTSRPTGRLQVPHGLRSWLIHALLLCRGIDAVDEREVRKAPELFGLELRPGSQGDPYPFIERHTEGGGRIVLTRSTPPVPSRPLPSARENPQLALEL